MLGSRISRLGDNSEQNSQHVGANRIPQISPAFAVNQAGVTRGQVVFGEIGADGIRFQLIQIAIAVVWVAVYTDFLNDFISAPRSAADDYLRRGLKCARACTQRNAGRALEP